MSSVPKSRIRAANDRAVRAEGRHVLYWMTASRRTRWNFGLQRATELARELRKPLIVLEALRVDYPWASERLHLFVLQGMADNATRFARTPIHHHAYVEPEAGRGSGLLAALAAEACLIVADDFPGLFLPRMLAATAARTPVRFEAVDSNGLLPLSESERVFPTAQSFRRHLQARIPAHLGDFPRPDPLAGCDLPTATLPAGVAKRWPAAPADLFEGKGLGELPIDHSVGPAGISGGERAGRLRLREFLESRVSSYGAGRNHPDEDASSGLSAHLHFGHLSAHQVFQNLADLEGWKQELLRAKVSGSRSGWWQMGEGAEAFLDQLVTWRELGFHRCHLDPEHDDYESLPPWALTTLREHEGDERPIVYGLEQLRASETHDPIWNAAQRQLVREGRMQNDLRMLWGKKVLEWSPSPRDALRTLFELNNRFALDGRDPNSSSGILWCFGLFDRPWGPERPIFGKVRDMSSDNTARKLRLKRYLEGYSA